MRVTAADYLRIARLSAASDVHLDEVGRVVSAMNAFSPSDGPSDWASIFHAVDDQLAGSTFPTKEVVLITDLRKSGWDAPGGD